MLAWFTTMSRFRSRRSATTPTKGVTTSIGMELKNDSRPNIHGLLSVRRATINWKVRKPIQKPAR